VAGRWPGDLAERVEDFVAAVFGPAHREENLAYVASALGVGQLAEWFLGPAGGSRFYADHLRRYKQRPIYWLWSSKAGSFNAVMYLHRYWPGAPALVAAQVAAYREQVRRGAGRRRAKMLVELDDYVELALRPVVASPPVLDLDEGVQRNYRFFGPALRRVPGL
ncbi:MAG TPA: hypothetical protein VFC72_00975, partial [Corynebacterium sp.]|nr:hypothetical protein [Corynebacterium sp.]